LVAGQPEYHPEAVYYLRYLKAGKRIWQSVGTEADAALAAFQNAGHDQQAVALGRSVGPTSIETPTEDEQPKAGLSLAEAKETYLAEVKRFRSRKTIAACEQMLNLFCTRLPAKLINEVTRQNLLDHMSFLRENGAGDRTIYNHISRIGTLLKDHGISSLLKESDKPRYDEKAVEAYNSDEVAALFATATPDKRSSSSSFWGRGFANRR
jgi:hypothetical protein